MKPLDDGLKQRLIGAIILLALGVIFLPVLFDREPIEPVDRATQIPPAPEIITVDIRAPDTSAIETADLAPDPDEMYVPEDVQEVDLQPETVGLDTQGLPKSWVLQVASFKNFESAEELRVQLAENEFPAYVREVNIEGEKSTRVLVGPKLDKKALVADKAKIDQMFSVDSMLLEFKP